MDADTQAERLNHALYGLIIVTATLVAERGHVENAGEAIVLLLGTALVLVLAHTYSAAMAARAVGGSRPGHGGSPPRRAQQPSRPLRHSRAGSAVRARRAGGDQPDDRLPVLHRHQPGRTGWSRCLRGQNPSMTWPKALLSGMAAGAIGVLAIAVEALID